MQYPVISVEDTGKRIKEVCEKRGIQAKEIREYMNFAAMQSVYDWFRGKNLPSLDNLYALSRLLNVSMDELIVASDQKDREEGAFRVEYELLAVRCKVAAKLLMVYAGMASNHYL